MSQWCLKTAALCWLIGGALFIFLGCQDSRSTGHSEHDGHSDHKADEGNHDDHDDHVGHDEHEGEGAVRISHEVAAEFGIELGSVGSGVLREEIVLPGEVEYNREQIAEITPRFQATVTQIRVRLADAVKKGDVLAVLESNESLQPFEVTAPFDGVVVEYNLMQGKSVEAGTTLFVVADLSSVWADLRIYQRDLAKVEEGQPVVIEGRHDEQSYSGKIEYVAPTIDEHTRTGMARVVVANDDRQWKPGQFIEGRIAVEEHPVDVAVPHSAILTMDGKVVVFVEEEGGFEPRPVDLGHHDSEQVEVTAGLLPGETIVLKNPISLKAELGKEAFGGHVH